MAVNERGVLRFIAGGFLGLGGSGAAFAVDGDDAKVVKLTFSAGEVDAVRTLHEWRAAGYALPSIVSVGVPWRVMTAGIGRTAREIHAFTRDAITPLDRRDVAVIPRFVPWLRRERVDADVLRESGGTAPGHASEAALTWLCASTERAANAALKTYRAMLDATTDSPLTAGVGRDLATPFDTSAADRIAMYDAVPGNMGRRATDRSYATTSNA